jgi:hypothetical protein
MAEGRVDKGHERLWALAGNWATSGHVVGDPPVPVSGSDVYEVLPGGYFVVHHVDVTVGAQTVRAVELIGEQGSREDTFLARSYARIGLRPDKREVAGSIPASPTLPTRAKVPLTRNRRPPAGHPTLDKRERDSTWRLPGGPG